ncbi:hypothetical protein ORD21_15885 [Deinococcus sp. ZS9-10]|uniref:DUF11 domain-containing protein n=1 Tax=Deinococcus arenicola TaxID=2994950 RepID=A0ABU4DUJ1_9DEIO|nr:hypothetical protein [Deinococcus sp. ZS9-10]
MSPGTIVRPGDVLEYAIIVRNAGTVAVPSATFQDSIPAGTKYVANSTWLNTLPVADAGTVAAPIMPFVTARSIGSPEAGAGNGLLLVDATPGVTTDREAAIRFQVTVDTLPPIQVNNTDNVTYVGSGIGVTVSTNTVSTPIVVNPNITLLKLGRNIGSATSLTPNAAFADGTTVIGVKPGDTVEYCIVYRNAGGVATNFVLTDNVPVIMNALLGAYDTPAQTGIPAQTNRGVYWAPGSGLAVNATARPAGVPATILLTSASGDDQGTLTTTGGLGKGMMTLNLGTAGLLAGTHTIPTTGTVCFQAKVP